MAQILLIHSPFVGPATWRPVADRLRTLGHETVVPSLVELVDSTPTFWQRIVAHVAGAVDHLDPDEPVLLVAHSNASLFVPLLRRGLGRPVRAVLLVDARLPAEAGSTPVASSAVRDILPDLAVDGVLPPWSRWWSEDEIAPLFPDAGTRAEVTAEEPHLPVRYFAERIPVPTGWDDVPCGYLQFSPAYDADAAEADRRGWLVDRMPGGHLHQLVDANGVADRLLEMGERARQKPTRTV